LALFETAFSSAFENLLSQADLCGFQTRASILPDAIDGFGNDDSSNVLIFLQGDFTFLM
jgi:hypothetical protein